MLGDIVAGDSLAVLVGCWAQVGTHLDCYYYRGYSGFLGTADFLGVKTGYFVVGTPGFDQDYEGCTALDSAVEDEDSCYETTAGSNHLIEDLAFALAASVVSFSSGYQPAEV